ncbi:MAG: hypothetical protein P8J32_00175 [bacterium]|nr:hypothetical protein [bacterium]
MNIVKAILLGLIVYVSIYFGLPTWQMDNPSMWFMFVFWGLSLVFLGSKTNIEGKIQSTAFTWIGVALTVLPLLVVMVQWIGGWRWPNEDNYRDLIGKVEYKVYSDEVAPIDQSKIFVIPPSTASLLAEKAFVSKDDTSSNVVGSLASLGRVVVQEVNDGIYYVAPTLHRSFWKWRENKQGTPGYIMVNAVNEKDVQYVDDYKIVYQPGACFTQNLERHLWLNGYSATYKTDYLFEIDDTGRPYWVVSTYDRTIGMSGKDANGCLVVDAETGEINEYTIEKTPLWVDRIQPAEFVHKQLVDWGSLAEGYINWQDLNRKHITDGMSVVYGNDKQCYYYTGVTSVGKDDATIGFVEVNTRTKEAVFYKKAGATEAAAMRSANDLYSDLRYESTFPKTYNINGEPTYIMGMKASSGMIKAVCMVNVEDYNTVGNGETIGEALRSYRGKLTKNIHDAILSEDTEQDLALRIVARYHQDAESGMFYALLDSLDKMTLIDGTSFQDAYLTQIGDSVIVAVLPSETATESAIYFDNINLDITVSEKQKELENNLKNPVLYDNGEETALPTGSEKDSRKKGKIPNS